MLVCEVMAQQTQVARVAERWRPFLDRFPTPSALADVPVAEAIRWWSGLGYNRRAVALHRTAPGRRARPRRPAARRTSTPCSRSRASGPTRRERSWPSHSKPTRASSTPTPPGSSPDGPDDGYAPRRRRRPPTTPCPRAGRGRGTRRCSTSAPACAPGARPAAPCARSRDECAWGRAGHPEPDPADGSAGVSGGQSRFEGSDRQGRGRLVAVLRSRAVASHELAEVMGWPDDPLRADRVAATLLGDGLVTRHVTDHGARYRLAGD